MMKTRLACLTLLPALVLVIACGRAKTDPPLTAAEKAALASSSTQALTYEFTDGTNCTTGTRQYGSVAELCLNLQIETSNNSCAIDQRRAAFKTDCPKLVWNPAAASTTLLQQTGAYVSCDLMQTDPTTNITTKIHQENSGRSTTLKLESSTAFVQMLLINGRFHLDIFMSTADAKSEITKQVWRDQAPQPLTFTLSNSKYVPVITCTPSIVADGVPTPVTVD